MGDKITEDNAYKGFYLIGRAVGCYYSAELQGGGREIIQYQKEVKRSQLNTFLRRMKVRRMEWLLKQLYGEARPAHKKIVILMWNCIAENGGDSANL